MVSGYFVVQKLFEFFFRYSVVLKFLPTVSLSAIIRNLESFTSLASNTPLFRNEYCAMRSSD
jgi:uncharacterized membrane protein